jgi:AraC family transcriptional regulator
MIAGTQIPVERGSISVRTLELRQFRVSEACFPAALHLPSHYHPLACMTLMLDGGFRERLPGSAMECSAGTVLVKPAGERHEDCFGSTGSQQLIIEPISVNDDTLPEVGTVFGSVAVHRNPTATALALHIRSEMTTDDAATRICVEGLVLEVFGAMLRCAGFEDKPPSWLRRVLELLTDDPLADVRVGQLATAAGVHPVYLARQFRRHFGHSIGGYVRAQRLAWAAQELASSDRSLVDIALTAGFADQSHFTRHFARQFGAPPRRFRLAHRANRAR